VDFTDIPNSERNPIMADNRNQGTGGVAQQAKDSARSVANAATGAMSSATEQAQHAAETMGGGIRSLAGSIREHKPQGVLGTAAETVAEKLDSSGRYLEQEGFSGMAEDIAGMVRRHPMPCVLAGVGVGFLLGWLMTHGGHSARSI
jgi:hypothetical protein